MKISKEPALITRRGKPIAVILPVKEYEALLERIEDAEDLLWLEERRKKPMSFRNLDAYLADRPAR
jgi:PHD/YefM family antitoxin component YafN of YafNO toxin-antitoxin module